MAKVSGKETGPEILLRKFLFFKGIRYRKNYSRLPGTPDIVIHRYRTVLFINGCFWHGHSDCKYAKLPSSNVKYWKNKISENIERDHRKNLELKDRGWNIIIVWQCELKNKELRELRFEKLEVELDNALTIIKSTDFSF